MLRCECRARLGRGWRFCEACGRPVPAEEAQPAHQPEVAVAVPMTAEPKTWPVDAEVAKVNEPVTTLAVIKPRTPPQSIARFDWRFGILPVLLGLVLALPMAWFSVWFVPVGALLGAAWGWRKYRMIQMALRDFTLEWIFEKVDAYGPCALGVRAWWPTGVLYLTEQTLKFKPFKHTNECEVSLDPVRITGIDFPTLFSWPSDWACILISSSYGPVFGTIKVFDRIKWGQWMQTARQRVSPSSAGDIT
jgi:hypothetical protein